MIYDGYQSSQFGYNIPQPYTNGQLAPHIFARLAAKMEHKAAPGWYNNSTGQFTPPSGGGGPSPIGSPFGGISGALSGGHPYPSIAVGWKIVSLDAGGAPALEVEEAPWEVTNS